MIAELLEISPRIARMVHFVTGSIASPSDLPPAELYAAAAALILNVAGLVLIRALSTRAAPRRPADEEYDEAA